MTPAPTLEQQREALRGEIHLQREKLTQRLALTGRTSGRYPRSLTMRMLMQRPGLLAKIAALVIGPGATRSISTGLALVDALQSANVR